jgi:integrase
VLSVEEVTLLLRAATAPKYKAAFATAYGAGLRVSEVVALKVGDIDSERMLLRVERGKGRKDRHAMLSPQLLELLRAWWREGRRRSLLLPGGWLFPGRNPVEPLSARQIWSALAGFAIVTSPIGRPSQTRPSGLPGGRSVTRDMLTKSSPLCQTCRRDRAPDPACRRRNLGR